MAKIKTNDMSINPDAMPKSKGTENSAESKGKRISTRKVLPKNMRSHRRGHRARGRIYVQTNKAAIVYIPAEEADKLVSEGSGKYLAREKAKALLAKKKAD